VRIFRKDGLYLCRTVKQEEKIALKANGFSFDRQRKLWYTDSDDAAEFFYDFTAKNARKRLDNLKDLKREIIAESFATTTDANFPSPEGLNYLDFQRAGIEYAVPRKFTLIADQPGLGKTIQAIGISNAISSISRILIIVPAGLKVNWFREFLRWDVKGLSVGVTETKRVPIKGTKRTKAEYVWPDTNVVITNYEMVKAYPEIKQEEWDYIICDESHMINNGKADRTRQVFGYKRIKPVRGKKWVFLTGTPILSRPIELWTLIQFVDREGLGENWQRYVYRYCAAMETPWGIDTSGASNTEELGHILRRKFMVRRMKADVLTELPSKIRNPVFLPAEGMKRVVKKEYSTFLDNLARLESFNEDKEYTPEDYKDASPDEISALMQSVFDRGIAQDWDSELATKEESDKVHFEAMSGVREDVALAKLDMVKAYVDNLLLSEDKVIVFVVHKAVAKALKEKYPDAAIVVGGMTPAAKQENVDLFQNNDDCNLFIGNIDAAGVGYTLTAASHVVMAELCWVPAKAEQAEDRAHRISQTETVVIHYLLVDGSIECYMIDALLAKQDMISEILDEV
jgi:SWI/SNF-related matrix-associated actin-dependent regulator 1 of chromatin subfamily A